MWTIQPTYCIIKTSDSDKEKVIMMLKSIVDNKNWYKRYVRICDDLVNWYVTIFISWDWSKEWWQESNYSDWIFDKIIEEFDVWNKDFSLMVDVMIVAWPWELYEKWKFLDISTTHDE